LGIGHVHGSVGSHNVQGLWCGAPVDGVPHTVPVRSRRWRSHCLINRDGIDEGVALMGVQVSTPDLPVGQDEWAHALNGELMEVVGRVC